MALIGAQLPDIMAHVGWKSSKMADHYIKLNQVLAPGVPSDNLSKISLDLLELYTKQKHLQRFLKAFCTVARKGHVNFFVIEKANYTKNDANLEIGWSYKVIATDILSITCISATFPVSSIKFTSRFKQTLQVSFAVNKEKMQERRRFRKYR